MIQLHLDCVPTSWSAPVKGKTHFYDKKAKEKEFARWQIRGQYRDIPLQGFFSLEFVFFIPIPKETSKARRVQMLRRQILPTTPDTTNMQKFYEDCLQGIVIENDRYANKICSVRYYSEKPGVTITVRPWDEEQTKVHQPNQNWIKV
jgi:Holliday junction resolvase RusA-like endonuclease